MTDITERIYSTPRTYGSPTGRDHEISHLPNWRARLAGDILQSLLQGGARADVVHMSCNLADEMLAEIDKRGWLIEVTPAPDLDANYGKRKEKANG